MAKYEEVPIQYGMKLIFEDGSVVNWYKDGKRKTVHAERNPHHYDFPRSASRIEEILGTMSSKREGAPSPPWRDKEGRPVGAFDGGSDPNPGPGGWGVVLPDDREICGGEAATTNNRMELIAAIHLLKATQGPLRALGDSRYVIDGITRWIHAWHKRSWRTVSGTPVENRDLWEKLQDLAKGRQIVWEHVRAHSGHPLNERCDRLCGMGRRKIRKSRGRR